MYIPSLVQNCSVPGKCGEVSIMGETIEGAISAGTKCVLDVHSSSTGQVRKLKLGERLRCHMPRRASKAHEPLSSLTHASAQCSRPTSINACRIWRKAYRGSIGVTYITKR
jgi:hypothetical protein